MKQLMVDSTASASHSFLLDDDSTIPFSHGEIEALMDDTDLLTDMPVPAPLKEERSFSFLTRPVAPS